MVRIKVLYRYTRASREYAKHKEDPLRGNFIISDHAPPPPLLRCPSVYRLNFKLEQVQQPRRVFHCEGRFLISPCYTSCTFFLIRISFSQCAYVLDCFEERIFLHWVIKSYVVWIHLGFSSVDITGYGFFLSSNNGKLEFVDCEFHDRLDEIGHYFYDSRSSFNLWVAQEEYKVADDSSKNKLTWMIWARNQNLTFLEQSSW